MNLIIFRKSDSSADEAIDRITNDGKKQVGARKGDSSAKEAIDRITKSGKKEQDK